MVEPKKGLIHRFAQGAQKALTRWTGQTPVASPPETAIQPIASNPNTDGGDVFENAGIGSGGTRLLTAALMREWTESAQAILHETYDFNPDDLVQTKGKNIKIYQEMLRDPYVKAALLIKKLSVLRLPVEILPASKKAQDQEIAAFVEDQLECMRTPWHELLMGVMDCVDCGYSIGEINYKVIDRGDYRGMVGWDTVKSKDPYVYSFRITRNGEVEKVIQRLGVVAFLKRDQEGDMQKGEYPPDKFLISSFQPKYQNPYGSSDLRAAYRAFFIKDWAWKFRAIFMEKWGSPTVVGSFPNGTPESRRQELEDVLESIQQETTLTIPEDLKIEIIRVATTANITEYERSIADLNKEILVGMLGSFMAVEEGKRTGARAQGQVHLWIAKLFVEALVYQIEEDLNRQMVRRLVDMNYPNVVKYPRVKFELSRVEELISEMELDTGLQNMGFPIDEDYVAKKYGRPQRNAAQGRAVDGTTDGTREGKVLVPIAQQMGIQENAAYAARQQGKVAKGGNPSAAGPSSDPVTNLSESLATAFYNVRGKTLPDDPRKIGALKDAYVQMIRIWGAVRGVDKFSEADAIAFDLAGQERAHHQTHGAWMDEAAAYTEFLKRMMKG